MRKVRQELFKRGYDKEDLLWAWKNGAKKWKSFVSGLTSG
jgi:hypothetical protein